VRVLAGPGTGKTATLVEAVGVLDDGPLLGGRPHDRSRYRPPQAQVGRRSGRRTGRAQQLAGHHDHDPITDLRQCHRTT